VKEGKAHIGTSGWSYKHWKEIFYPPKMKSTDWFVHYAAQFGCSEINTSFYHLPKESTVQKWTDISPKKFRFCPKLSRFITHMKKLRDAEEPLKVFFGRFAPMQAKMGPVLIQLPPMLGFHEQVVRTFFDLLVINHPKNEFVLEVRHETWLKDEVYELLRNYGIGFVISQSDKFFPYAEAITSKQVYLRFHGPGDLYASEYSTRMLKSYAGKCRKWMQEGRTVWCFFNNDIHGYAFNDAKRLRNIIEADTRK
jgi:uncharacterized protein YecE (DUF72 family)